MTSTTGEAPEATVEPDAEPHDEATAAERAAVLAHVSTAPFGPAFFVSQLADMIRDSCPDPAEAMPLVQLHLADGTCLNVCHVIALAPSWVALAVYDAQSSDREMCTELVLYGTIARVSIRARRPSSHHIGFEQQRRPIVMS